MLKPIVAGNWKMNKTPKEGNSFISEVLEILSEIDNVKGWSKVVINSPLWIEL